MADIQSLYQEAIKFAAIRHGDQKVKGTTYSYIVHLSNVAMEVILAASHTRNFDLEFAVQVALLHDTIEDTSTSFDEIKDLFGTEIATAVMALSKNEDLPKDQQIPDSLRRIKKLRKEVWAVKLGDRITNLQLPPSNWTRDHRITFHKESEIVLRELREGNEYLAARLLEKIKEYSEYIDNKIEDIG